MKRLMKPKRTLFVLSIVLLAGMIGGGIGLPRIATSPRHGGNERTYYRWGWP